MKTFFDKIYFLTFTEDKKRVDNVLSQIKKLGLEKEQYEINYTSRMPYSDLCGRLLLGQSYERLGWIQFKNSFAGVFNCATEHYKMIRNAFWLGYEKILICEDDANFVDNVKFVEETFEKLPEKFGIVKFYYSDYKRTSKEFGLRSVFDYNDGIRSTLCYALDRDGMESYMKSFERRFCPADDVFEGCKNTLKVCTGPLICSPLGLESNIEN
jgi:hypothetical protein